MLFAVVMTLAVLLSGGGRPPTDRERSGGGRGGGEEAQEQQESTQERLEALREARAAGTFGRRERIVRRPAAGWVGERLVNVGTDDWEPALAADPHAPFVYVLVTRYGEPKPCPGNCPTPFMVLEISSDGGKTWSAGKPLCACKGSGQFDPIIEVVPDTGHVYSVYMNGYNVVFVKSTDHGQTWSTPVATYGNVAWNDKPVLATSDDGRDVYVSFNGPTGGDPWMAQSHDFGATWAQTKLVDSRRYYFAYDADVTSADEVVFSESSIDYSGHGGTPTGQVIHHAFISTDSGGSWTNVVVDSVAVGRACVAEGCGPDFYIGHSGVTSDDAGNLTYVYDGATSDLGPQSIFARRSTDDGLTWTPRVRLSRFGENATSPAVEATGAGDVRSWYMQTNGGSDDAWNVWYRRSTDGGITWSAPVKLSDAISGADYKTPAGFLEVYGDYGEIAITDAGKTIAVWGEGFSWTGPGGSWFNRER